MSLEGSTAALIAAFSSALLSAPDDHFSPLSGHALIPVPPLTESQSRGVRVTVALTAGGARKLSNAAIVFTRDVALPSATEPSNSDVAVHPDGSFVFSDVLPGAYRIRAHAGAAGMDTTLIAVHRIVVDTRDLSVTLTLLPGASVSGRLRAEGVNTAAPATFAGLRVQA